MTPEKGSDIAGSSRLSARAVPPLAQGCETGAYRSPWAGVHRVG